MNLLTERVIQSFLSSNAYIGCREVLHLEEIATIEYAADTQEAFIRILQDGDYQKIALLKPVKDLLDEELTMLKFNDENSKQYYGLYYDSVYLFQSPEVLAIVPITL